MFFYHPDHIPVFEIDCAVFFNQLKTQFMLIIPSLIGNLFMQFCDLDPWLFIPRTSTMSACYFSLPVPQTRFRFVEVVRLLKWLAIRRYYKRLQSDINSDFISRKYRDWLFLFTNEWDFVLTGLCFRNGPGLNLGFNGTVEIDLLPTSFWEIDRIVLHLQVLCAETNRLFMILSFETRVFRTFLEKISISWFEVK